MKCTVLAIDDSSTVRAILAKALRLSGVEVSRFGEASTGAQALERLREAEYDLVFCDLNMPGMTGFEFVEALRREGRLGSMAVVIISSLAYSAAIEDLRNKGVRGYLRKPLRPEAVRELVDRVMGAAHEPTA